MVKTQLFVSLFVANHCGLSDDALCSVGKSSLRPIKTRSAGRHRAATFFSFTGTGTNAFTSFCPAMSNSRT